MEENFEDFQMNQWTRAIVLGGSILFVAAGCTHKKAVDSLQMPTTSKITATKPSGDDFDRMIHQTHIEGDQLKAFEAKRAERTAAIAAWEASDEKKAIEAKIAELTPQIDAAKKANDTAKVTALEAQKKELQRQARAPYSRWRGVMVGMMTTEQQHIWATEGLVYAAKRRIRHIDFTEEQNKQIFEVCKPIAVAALKPDYLTTDPYLGAMGDAAPEAVQAIHDQVMTAEQKAIFDKDVQAAAAKAAATRAAAEAAATQPAKAPAQEKVRMTTKPATKPATRG